MSKESRIAEAERRMLADGLVIRFLRSRLGAGKLVFVPPDSSIQFRGGDALWDVEEKSPSILDFKSPTRFLQVDPGRGDETLLHFNLAVRNDEDGGLSSMFREGYIADHLLIHWFSDPYTVSAHALVSAPQLVSLITENSDLLKQAGCKDWQWVSKGAGEYLAIRDMWKFCRAWGITGFSMSTYSEPVSIKHEILAAQRSAEQKRFDWCN